MFHSQYGQDRYLHENLFLGQRGGTFVEIGALDGLLDSNTLFFERELGWSGVLVEPNPAAFALLAANRPGCAHENVAIYDRDATLPFLQIRGGLYGWSGLVEAIEPQHQERIAEFIAADALAEIPVEARTLDWLLARHGLTHIDLLSIDTEGSEAAILRAFPWQRVTVGAFCIEDNFQNHALDGLMAANGYQRIGRIGPDDLFARSDRG